MTNRGKIDTTSPLYCAKRQAKEGTVFDTIRKIIGDNKGEIQYQALLEHLQANWKPEKAETYGPGYIRAYVTGGIKEGYLTQDLSLRVEYSFRPKGGAKAIKAAAEAVKKPVAPPTTTKVVIPELRTRNDVLQCIRDIHGFTNFEDSGERATSVVQIADGIKTSVDEVSNIVHSCVADGLLTQGVDGAIFLTRTGYKQTKRSLEKVDG